MKKQEHFFIQVLKWAENKKSFKDEELREYFDLDNKPVENKLMIDFGPKLFSVVEGSKFALSYDAFFHLLEYKELKEARQSSRCAMFIATLAFVVSSMLAAGQLITTMVGV